MFIETVRVKLAWSPFMGDRIYSFAPLGLPRYDVCLAINIAPLCGFNLIPRASRLAHVASRGRSSRAGRRHAR
jgi:hypothetical protein